MSTSTVSDRQTWVFDTEAWSDLTVEAGAQCVRTFHVHKAVVCPAIGFIFDQCTVVDGTEVKQREDVHTIHIPENPDVVETMLRHAYGFHDPRLQLKTIANIDLSKKSIFQEFRFFWDLRLTSRKYGLASMDHITRLLAGACLQHENVKDDEIIRKIGRVVIKDLDQRSQRLHDLAAQEANIRRKTSGQLFHDPEGSVYGPDSTGTYPYVRITDHWAEDRVESKKWVKLAGLSWILEDGFAEEKAYPFESD